MTENEVSGIIVDRAIAVHAGLGGPGLVESVYEEALVWELESCGLQVSRQLLVPIAYKGRVLATPLRLDLRVHNLVIVECKATEQPNKIFRAQLLTYLRLTGLKLGLLINFGERFIKNGMQRIVNGL